MIENTTVVTYAGTPVHEGLQLEFDKLYGKHFDNHIAFTRKDIEETDFFQENQQVFKYTKYSGYFLWKPYIIDKVLRETKSDYILYCDANVRFNDLPRFKTVFLNTMNKEGVFFIKHAYHKNHMWTKRDVFYYMKADKEEFWFGNQIWASCMGFSKDKISKKLIRDYFRLCKDPRLVTEIPNESELDNLPEFKEHRWDQSVMSILVQKAGIEGVWDTETIKYVNKIYPPKLVDYKVTVDPLETVDGKSI